MSLKIQSATTPSELVTVALLISYGLSSFNVSTVFSPGFGPSPT